MEPIAEFVHRGDLLSTAILDSTSAKSRQMSSFSLATRLLLLLITGYPLFTCRKQDDIRSNHTNIVFKPASFDILFRNWTQLLVSLRRHRQMSASTCILKLNSSVSILLLILIANDCSTINPGPPQNPCGECGKAVRSNHAALNVRNVMYGIINAVSPSIVSISESLSNIHHTFGYAAIVAYRVLPRNSFCQV